MLFNSLSFLFFFPIVTLCFFLLPHAFRWFLLLVASCYFYMFFKPVYILILFFTIIIDYYAGILIEQQQDQKKKKSYLLMSLIANIGILAVFKYYNFINLNISHLLSVADVRNPIPFLSILLPIGLSFHTFQAMSYTIEVYRGKQKAERHFGIYALYVMFYPQLVAGPIERPQNVLHQFHEKKYFDAIRANSGLRLMLLGFFKKIVIADNLSPIVDRVFNNPSQHNGITALMGAVFFTVQIYADFSGYSDIAIGSARVMGFDLMKNFNLPYFSASIRDFWSRWHISLSTWFRDYLYIPLGGNKKGKLKQYLNQFIVFMISGLWHGANWTFVIWGALHGSFLIIENIFNGFKINFFELMPVRFIRRIFTLLLVVLAWVFFRAKSVSEAAEIIKKIITDIPNSVMALKNGKPVFAPLHFDNSKSLFLILIGISCFFFMEFLREKNFFKKIFNRISFLRWSVYYTMVVFVIISLSLKVSEAPFIYFQF